MTFFCVDGLSAGYGGTAVLKELSFSLENNCVMGILGANGSGKTTLIKSICGIVRHTGSCVLEGQALEGLSAKQIAKRISYIPQRSGISIDIPVLDVVLMGFNPQLAILEHPTKAMRAAAENALARVGLAGFEEKNYLHLSEGQKQLCILARTMVSGSRMLLLDEPESALDFQHRYRMLDLIHSWIGQTNGSAMVTLHDPILALNRCNQLMVLKNGGILDILCPATDCVAHMEKVLRHVYGPVSLHRIRNRTGQEVLTLLKEDEQ